MSEQEAFEKFWGDRYKNTVMHDQAKTAWNAAIAYMQEHNKSAEQSEPVAEIILDPSFLPALRVPLIDWKTPIVDFEVGTKLYDKPQPLKRLDADKIGFIFRKEMTLFEFYNALMDATEELNHD